jgi:hypothetical protein
MAVPFLAAIAISPFFGTALAGRIATKTFPQDTI